MTYEITGHAIVGTQLAVERGQGTRQDLTTGETFHVTFHLATTGPLDGSGPFTGHVITIFTHGPSTTTYRAVANFPVRPDEPVYLGFEFATCAGAGKATF